MMKLRDRDWKEFLFPEIFEIKNGFYNKKPNSSGSGMIPFLGATANNNGITEYYTLSEIEQNSKIGYGTNEPLDRKIFKGNCIAVTNNGSVGYAFYQVSEFTCSHDINPLYLKNHTLNSYIAKFLITTIEQQKVCFEYARKWRPIRMKKSRILLPINTKGQPDYDFMENYIKQKEAELLKLYKKQVSDLEPIVSLAEKRWKEFKIIDIFNDIQRGKRLKKDDHKSGIIPYISSSGINNGVDGFIGNNEDVRIFSNCLTLANSGSVGATFYQPFSFIASDHVTKLENRNFNKYVYLFIANITSRFNEKYSFNREINDKRIKKEKILLPVNTQGRPDYFYMENYMIALENKKIKQYMEYKNSPVN